MEWIISGVTLLIIMGIIIVAILLRGLKHHRVKIILSYKDHKK